MTPNGQTPINFGDLSMYAGGFILPIGDYALEFNVQMFKPEERAGRQSVERLGVMVKAHPLESGEPVEQFYSMGSKAHLSFAPNPETGKGLVAIPGGPASSLPDSTNWSLLLHSMYDAGLPPGVFTNDMSVIDGIHVHIEHVPEPEERKGFASATSELEPGQARVSRNIAVVSEIKEDGKPWEGTGGIPEKKEAAPKPKVNGKAAAAKPAAKAPAPKAAPAPAAAAAPTDDDLATQSLGAVAAVLEQNPNGMLKLQLRTGAFKAIKGQAADAKTGDAMANAMVQTYFASDEALDTLIGQLGYKVAGPKIVTV